MQESHGTKAREGRGGRERRKPRDPDTSLRTPASSERRQAGGDFRREEPLLAAHCLAPGSNRLVHTALQGRQQPPTGYVYPRQTCSMSRPGISSLRRKTAQPPRLAPGGGRDREDSS